MSSKRSSSKAATTTALTTLFWLFAPPAFADYHPTAIDWPGWRITTSENLYAGKTKRARPVSLMVDGNRKTGWVFGGKLTIKDGSYLFRSRHSVKVASMNKHGVALDRLTLSLRAHAKVAIWIDGKRVAEQMLAGRKTFSVKLAKGTRLRELELSFRAVKGRLKVYELSLYKGGKKRPFNLPNALQATDGDTCGCGVTFDLIRGDGRTIVKGVDAVKTSPDKKRIAGTTYKAKRISLWVYQQRSRKLRYTSLIKDKGDNPPSFADVRWLDNNKIEAIVNQSTPIVVKLK
jgi:hypothetical protein